MGPDPDNEVQATKTTLRVVETLEEIGGGGVTEIARHMGISKSAVHKHLTTLSNYGYVTKTDDEYDLGLKFLTLGNKAQRRQILYDLGQSHLEHIPNVIEAQSALVVEEGGHGVYLLVERSTEQENHSPTEVREGDQVRLPDTAAGKVILAHCSTSRLETLSESSALDVGQDATDDDRNPLSSELETIRVRGVAIDGSDSGRRSAAAPIIGPENRVVGAVEVLGDADQLTSRRLKNEVARLVNVTAQRVSKELQLWSQ